MARIKGAAFRFSALDVARAFAQRQSRPARVVLVPDELRPYGHYWVVSPAGRWTLPLRYLHQRLNFVAPLPPDEGVSPQLYGGSTVGLPARLAQV